MEHPQGSTLSIHGRLITVLKTGITVRLKVNCLFILFPEPVLKDLVLLPTRSWYILGIQLSLPEDKLGEIKRNNPGDDQSCKTEMFSLWLRTASPLATYEQLVEALHRLGENSTVEHICHCHGM